ncbi:hypothetical protein Syun_006162 [Stephania yunnanensis]|uniref:Uncharacterized protein n=1 Tax=Stephania yunnanensis TaxID=152371 RepID=A0AAP0Q131_9MAGN
MICWSCTFVISFVFALVIIVLIMQLLSCVTTLLSAAAIVSSSVTKLVIVVPTGNDHRINGSNCSTLLRSFKPSFTFLPNSSVELSMISLHMRLGS